MEFITIKLPPISNDGDDLIIKIPMTNEIREAINNAIQHTKTT